MLQLGHEQSPANPGEPVATLTDIKRDLGLQYGVPLPVAYRQSARRETAEAARRYESERQGLAALFLAEVGRIDMLIAEPNSFVRSSIKG